MTQFKEPIATLTFVSELVMEYSALPNAEPLGTFQNKMSLYIDDEDFNNCIIWNFGKQDTNEDEEVIGLEIEGRKVVGYDGLMSLPMQAVLLLKAAGFDTTEVEDSGETPSDPGDKDPACCPFCESRKLTYAQEWMAGPVDHGIEDICLSEHICRDERCGRSFWA